ncbi:uncharacterized protein LOC143018616 isoform X2 [Oratosquilla oratoria]|uniref:uncharacterized protein LOC143018616 isoform X2 n=1 Tax=Oratosquilla oratoria TaxID=337810 RepID=UPI003F7649A3
MGTIQSVPKTRKGVRVYQGQAFCETSSISKIELLQGSRDTLCPMDPLLSVHFPTSATDSGKEGILRGPRRLFRLCTFALVVPVVLVTIPMYARLVLYPPHEFSMAPTDQRHVSGSSLWCQSQTFHMNGSFNAYMLPDIPTVKLERKRYTMLQRLRLSDDVKEYWGFNLLQGSKVTLSSCSRWEGAQVLILRGVNNLHHCAWIGEEDSSEEPAELDFMFTPQRGVPQGVPDSSNSTQQQPIPRISTQAKHQSHERRTNMANLIQEVVKMSKNKQEILGMLYKQSRHYSQEGSLSVELDPDEPLPAYYDSEDDPVKADLVETSPVDLNNAPQSQPSFLSDAPVPVKEALTQHKLKKGRRKGNKGKKKGNQKKAKGDLKFLENVRERRDLMQMEAEAINEEDGAFEVDEYEKRLPFHYVDGDSLPEGLHVEQHQPWVGRRLQPSGIADDRGTIDQRTANDRSMEEHRSSFSSSEEALASCSGVLLALPLVPDRRCNSFRRNVFNTITYDIPVTGTYYFVFSSDNEITDNKVLFNLTMDKVVYDVAPFHDLCLNKTECSLPVGFWSKDQAVVEVDGPPHWQEAYQLNTSCDPRVAVYLTFVLLVPLLILFCALR